MESKTLCQHSAGHWTGSDDTELLMGATSAQIQNQTFEVKLATTTKHFVFCFLFLDFFVSAVNQNNVKLRED